MLSLPKEYRELSEKFANILRSKPKRGYLESIVQSGQPDPLDPIEEASMAVSSGKKESAINILESARQSDEKRILLDYIEELDNLLDELIASINALPEPETKQVTESTSGNNRIIIITVVVITAVAAAVVYNFI